MPSDMKDIVEEVLRNLKDADEIKKDRIYDIKNERRIAEEHIRRGERYTLRGVKAAERAAPTELRIQLSNFLKEFVSKAVPYIVLLLFLYFLYTIFTGGFNRSSSRNRSNSVEEIKRYEQMIKNQFNGFFGSIYLFFYRIWNSITLPPQIKMLLNAYSQYTDGGPTVPRTLFDSGRCDNIQWIEKTATGEKGTCTSAIRPHDLTWSLSTINNSEFQGPDLKAYMKQTNNDIRKWTNNTEVIIPWDRSPETTFFVPQCEQAYFAEQCRPEDNPSKCEPNEQWANNFCCIKANLLVEQGLTCGLATFNLEDKNDKSAKYKKHTKIEPSYNIITGINQKPSPLYNSGSPTFTSIPPTTASGMKNAFLGDRYNK